MAGPGGGPSRRSHTKSRKGCRTCKRRHIRCDESFPQCKNCTKHQVRCDYMDSPNLSAPDSPDGSAKANLLWTREIETTIDIWQQTGEFPFPELRVYHHPQWNQFPKVELRLIHHLSTIANEMLHNRATKLTVWTDYLPQVITMGASYHFVMQSMLAFSASHLAWISQSQETRNLASHYATAALRGLQQAISTVNRSNSDALLASAMLLQWVATDWRGWASLVSSSATIMNIMQPWKHESIFAAYLSDYAVSYPQHYMSPTGTMVTSEARGDHLASLQHLYRCLRGILPYLHHYEQERKWVDQLLGYIDRLQNSTPAQLAEEQFSQLYALRKWLFWVPISLLAVRRGDAMVLTVLAYFYAAALALEPMFPDVGSAFCASFALQPLEEILQTIESYQIQQGYNPTVAAAISSIAYPRETASNYRARRQRTDSVASLPPSTPFYDPTTAQMTLSGAFELVGSASSLSPAAPSPLSCIGQSQSSPFEARTSIDYSSSISSISSASGYMSPMISPTAPVLPYTTQEDSYSTFTAMPHSYAAGFVTTPVVWT